MTLKPMGDRSPQPAPAVDRPSDAAATEARMIAGTAAGTHVPDVAEVASLPPEAASPEAVARRFYDAFCAHRKKDMAALYAEDVSFKDAVFSYDDRAGTMGMWRKLLGNPDKAAFRYTFDRVEGDVAIGTWVADYESLGRPVRNVIESRLTVRDGLIVQHRDDFDLGRWMRQALPLGPLAELRPVQALVTAVLRAFIG